MVNKNAASIYLGMSLQKFISEEVATGTKCNMIGDGCQEQGISVFGDSRGVARIGV